MALKLITAPADSITDLATAKAHLNVTHTSDDTLIQAYLDAASAHLDGKDGITGRAMLEQTWELVLDDFPCGPIKLALPPLQSVTSIKYLDDNGTEQTLSTDDYVVDADSEPGWVAPVDAWPSTYDTVNAVRIRFVAGYAAVPAPLVAAALLMVGDLYANREAQVTGETVMENKTVLRLVRPYRMLSL